jgi:tetratricopeptide (TPR) repeat protein
MGHWQSLLPCLVAVQLCLHTTPLECPAGSVEEGSALVEKALQVWPHLAAAHFSKGVMASNARQLEAALGYYRRAVELMPRYPQVGGGALQCWRGIRGVPSSVQ